MEEQSFQDKYGDESSEFAEYSPKSEFSKPKLVETAVQKCLDARSQELKEGFFNYKIDSVGNVVKTWIPDSRKVYCSSVIALKFLMSPEINKSHDPENKEKGKKSYKEKIEEIEKEEKQIFENYAYTQMKQQVDGDRVKLVPSDNKYIPEYDAVVVLKKVSSGNMAVEVKGGWNSQVSVYWNEMVNISDKIFATINDLIDMELNYFKPKMSYG